MGTRADFYVGRGLNAEWIGSIAYDGYPFDERRRNGAGKQWEGGVKQDVLVATDEASYREAVTRCLKVKSNEGTMPAQGWPWSWNTSHLTDYAYAFDEGRVWMSVFGSEWRDPVYPDDDDDDNENGSALFPNMSSRSNVAPPGQERSGMLLLGFRAPKKKRR